MEKPMVFATSASIPIIINHHRSSSIIPVRESGEVQIVVGNFDALKFAKTTKTLQRGTTNWKTHAWQPPNRGRKF